MGLVNVEAGLSISRTDVTHGRLALAGGPRVPSVTATYFDVSINTTPKRLEFAKENHVSVSQNSKYSLC